MGVHLEGKHIRLVPFSQEYYDFVYRAECDMSEKHLWSDERCVPDGIHFAEDFAGRIRNYYFCYFIIVHKSGDPAGFVYAYQYNQWDKVVYAAIYLKPESRGTVAAAEAGMLFLNYLFGYYDLRKVYSLVYDYNQVSLGFQKNAGFVEEGCMRKHRYFRGEYYDVHLMAMYRETFLGRFGEEIGKLIVYKNTTEIDADDMRERCR